MQGHSRSPLSFPQPPVIPAEAGIQFFIFILLLEFSDVFVYHTSIQNSHSAHRHALCFCLSGSHERKTDMIEKIVTRLVLKNSSSVKADLDYWLSRSPEERISAVELLRRQQYGSATRLQRSARVIQRTYLGED